MVTSAQLGSAISSGREMDGSVTSASGGAAL
jgi:hypothetical protein